MLLPSLCHNVLHVICAHRFCQYVANFLLMPWMNKKVFYADQGYGWLKHGVLNNLNRICEPPCFEPCELCCAVWASSSVDMYKLFNFAFYNAGEMLVPEEHYGQAVSRVLRSFCSVLTFRMLEGNTQTSFSIPSSIPRIAIWSFNFSFLDLNILFHSASQMLLFFVDMLLLKYQECFFFF